jgi:serine/threonine protein kinase
MAEMGTPGWAAPELLLGEGVSKASDVFSFGIILWELLTFRAPSVLINMKMLQMPEVRNLPSTCNHPLLKMKSKQNHSVERSEKISVSSVGTNTSGFGGFFERKSAQNNPVAFDYTGIVSQDHDMTMIEIGDLHTAKVLMCDLKLRPPMPCNMPSALKNILASCWSTNEGDRPSFSDIYSDLEKMLVNQEFDKIDIPCDVEAVVNICSTKRKDSISAVTMLSDFSV